jgi:hypothetical protein
MCYYVQAYGEPAAKCSVLIGSEQCQNCSDKEEPTEARSRGNGAGDNRDAELARFMLRSATLSTIETGHGQYSPEKSLVFTRYPMSSEWWLFVIPNTTIFRHHRGAF